MEVHITRVLNDKEVEARVIRGGLLKSKKGFNSEAMLVYRINRKRSSGFGICIKC